MCQRFPSSPRRGGGWSGGRQVGSDVSSDFKILADTQEGQIVVNSEASSGENTTPVHAQHRLQATLGLLVRARRSSRHNKHHCICCVGLVKSTLNGFQTFMTLKTLAISRQLILEYYAPHPFFIIIIIIFNDHSDMRQTPEAPKQAKLTLTGIKRGVPGMEPNSRGLAFSE